MSRKALIIGSAGCAALLATTASADVFGPAIRITVSNNFGTASFEVQVADGSDDGTQWSYSLPPSLRGPMVDGNNNNVIGTLNGVTANVVFDPLITFSYSFVAAAGAGETTLEIDTAFQTFPLLPAENAIYAGSGAVIVTDDNDSADGATARGNFPDGAFYHGNVNAAMPGGGTTLMSLSSFTNNETAANVGNVLSVPQGEAVSFTQGQPPLPTGMDVTSMTGALSLVVSDGDNVDGTFTFAAIPAPGTIALLGLSLGSVATRRRR